MATSTNYGWSEPDNTSLVKDGAQAMRTLGDAIDTSVWNVGFGQAGKNKIINGNFGIWQRGTSHTMTSGVEKYTADRFYCYTIFTGGTSTVTQQTFTAGTAPVAGYEGQYFARYTAGTGTTYVELTQRIEDVRTFAGQTATLSFWAKASVNTTVSSALYQNFGSGGSSAVYVGGASYSATTSWQRFSTTVTFPSISGKTIGTNSFIPFQIIGGTLTNSQTIDIWGVQLEAGSIATPFQTASGGSIQSELAMCQRYYQKSYDQATALGASTFVGAPYVGGGVDGSVTTTVIIGTIKLNPMRTAPSVTAYDPSGNINKCTRRGASETANEVIGIDTLGQNGFRVYSVSGASANSFIFHYAASAEL